VVTRAETWAIVVNDTRQRDKTGPGDIVDAMYQDEDGGENDQGEPESKVVYQRVVYKPCQWANRGASAPDIPDVRGKVRPAKIMNNEKLKMYGTLR
jgi:hypothetical protein